MSGWRDQEGRTAADRKAVQTAADRDQLADRVRHRPMSFVRPVLAALFVGVLIVSLLAAYA